MDDAPAPEPSVRTLADLPERYPADRHLVFREDVGTQASLSGDQLRRRARQLGAALQDRLEPHAKVLLFLPDALDYICGLAGCFYANEVAVPMMADVTDDPDDVVKRLRTLAGSADARCVVTTAEVADRLQDEPELATLTVLDIHDIAGVAGADGSSSGTADAEAEEANSASTLRFPAADDPAMFLFTSGSTAEPKGVMMTHHAFVEQLRLTVDLWQARQDSVVVSWLPLSHNFGLSVGALVPLLVGLDSVILPASSFVKRPELWLRTIDEYGATHTGAPNFAFDYLCDHVSVDELASDGVSLASLTEVLCAGELIREETYRRFVTTFGAIGMSPSAFCPNYGMTEAGAFVTDPPTAEPVFRTVDLAELEQGRAVPPGDGGEGKVVASVGEPSPGVDLRIVDPQRHVECAPGEVGELWVKTPGAFSGYYKNESATREVLSAALEHGAGGYLRTGDLGFVEDGRVFIVGREKELIIVRGENHYPVDIEATITATMSGESRPVTVFGCEIDDEEQVVAIQEADPSTSEEECRRLLESAVVAISEKHRVRCFEIALVAPGSIARSPIGKILRKRTRTAYVDGELPIFYSYRDGEFASRGASQGSAAAAGSSQGRHGSDEPESGARESDEPEPDELEAVPAAPRGVVDTLVSEVFGPVLGRSSESLAASRRFAELGLDSVDYVQLARRIEDVFGISFGPSMLFKHKTIEELAAFLASTAPAGQVRAPTVSSSVPAHAEVPEAPQGIAVVGVSCRFPEATDVESFWQNLVAEKDCITSIENERPEIIEAYRRHYGDGMDSFPRYSGFVDDVADFDADFFGISPLEAQSMDPQQRKVLEMSWRAIEDAGYGPSQLGGQNVGVFVGVHNVDYSELVSLEPGVVDVYGAYLDSGLHTSLVANRVSRWFDFHGPSEIINTACSSSLIAIHHAIQSIRAGASSTALVAGVNVLLSPRPYRVSMRAGMLSGGGRCRTFDAAADGFVRSEGYAAVLLKPLEQAKADGDTIYGVIKSSAVNHDGRSNSLRAPNLTAQKELIKSAYLDSGLPLETVGYIEAHGTGTALGDPIEVQALQEAFAEIEPNLPERFCGLGSVKANIGHLESAAGLAGLIKVLLGLRHGTLPGLAHFQNLNPHISLQGSPFYVVERTREWNRHVDENGNESPRRAGISSFGFGGANGHVVVEEHIDPRERRAVRHSARRSTRPVPILLSAKTADALTGRARELSAFVRERSVSLDDVAYTLQVGRDEMARRVAFLVGSTEELCESLDRFVRGDDPAEGTFQPRPWQNSELLSMFSDAEMQEAIEKWIARGRYERLLELWVNGLDLDGRVLGGEGNPCRIPLPTYPFARERHWLSPAPASDAAPVAPAAPAAVPDTGGQRNAGHEPGELMLFEEVWEDEPLADATADVRTVICLLSSPEHQAAFTEQLRAADPRAMPVFVSKNGRGMDQGEGNDGKDRNDGKDGTGPVIAVDPDDVESFVTALQTIADRYGRPDAVVYLWAFEDPAELHNYTNIVHLLHAMARTSLGAQRLVLSAQPASELDRCYVESWIGFERSLRQAIPDLRAAAICPMDVGTNPAEDLRAWLPTLTSELRADRAGSVLYRDGRRQVSALREVSAPAAGDTIRRGGTYLITGGCGGLGFLFARHLASTANVNLILTGRSALDERQREQLSELEALGSRVLHIQADVSDETAMRSGLERARATFGPVHGVVHAAGVDARGTVVDRTAQAFDELLHPKISGTLVLDELLKDDPLDFSCYFSSVAAVVGDFGSCAYAAGNRFQNAYARYREERGYPGRSIAINWPLWASGGMNLASEDSTKLYLKSSGQRALESTEGVDVFDRLLPGGPRQCLVMSGDPERIRRFLRTGPAGDATRHPVHSPGSAPERIGPTAEPVRAVQPGRAVEPELDTGSLQARVRADLKEKVSALLRIPRERIDPGENLADFGFDSVSLTDLAGELSSHFGIAITPALFFDCPTLETLSRHYATEHADVLATFYVGGPDPGIDDEQRAVAVSPHEAADPAPVVGDPAPVAADPAPVAARSPVRAAGRSDDVPEPIAIIGMSGRFPDARTVDELWAILRDGREAVRDIPEDRFPGYGGAWRCGLVPGVSEFDPLFFEITPADARAMDPRQRLLLQESWNALEDAGYGADKIESQTVGMFVGVESGNYATLLDEPGKVTSNHEGVLAARLAYFLNLGGPAMAINTACSSGLVAAHEACWSLRNGECDTALAAGVNLMTTSDSFVAADEAGMLSPDGRCYAFDQRANGMVPGEAVAVVALKRLSDAEADRDRILGVIRGSGLNYDGKTNGITAPSSQSQTDLIRGIHDRYRIDPAAIDCVFTHGTGTRLGDPIEINALWRAFDGRTAERGSCALVTTKPNVGHALAASGLVSLIGLVQALRHQTIPASLYCEHPSDYVDWDTSPFYVNTSRNTWPRTSSRGRIGAVSAFGISGTNAHMIVEEYAAEPAAPPVGHPASHLLVLSARTPEELDQLRTQISDHLRSEASAGVDLTRVSYTLLTGRHHHRHRCAIVVRDVDEALDVWSQSGRAARPDQMFTGTVPREFQPQEMLQDYAVGLLSRARERHGDGAQQVLLALADLYCQGYDLPWASLFGEPSPVPVSLPTYPFAREHHWASGPASRGGADGEPAARAGIVHPLLHENTSDLTEQRFTSTFSPETAFVQDHDAWGAGVVPWAVQLEMARAAVTLSAAGDERTGRRLRDVVWSGPVRVGEPPTPVNIALYPASNEAIEFEIYRESGDAEAGRDVLGQGVAETHASRHGTVDLEQVRAACGVRSIGADRPDGRELGPWGIGEVHVGEAQLLAEVRLADEAEPGPACVISPLHAEAGLRAAALLVTEDPAAAARLVPAGVREVVIPPASEPSGSSEPSHSPDPAGPSEPPQPSRPFGRPAWAVARDAGQGCADVDLVDAQGRACLQLRGITWREAEPGVDGASDDTGLLMARPVFVEQPVNEPGSAATNGAFERGDRLVLLGGLDEALTEAVRSELPARSIVLAGGDGSIGDRFERAALGVFGTVQEILRDSPRTDVLIQLVVPSGGENRVLSGLAAMLESVRLENPKVRAQLIEVDPREAASRTVDILEREATQAHERRVRYVEGRRYAGRWETVPELDDPAGTPWKDGGIYLLTGGVGIAPAVGAEIAERAGRVTLVFAGRSPADDERLAVYRNVGGPDTKVEYRQADITRADDVRALVDGILRDFGTLDGIVHTAGVIRDGFAIRKSAESVGEVLAPKVTGLTLLDEATSELELDLFVLCSSIAGAFGNVGQLDYAAANAFLDAYASYRDELVRAGRRHGRTLSVNWPLWRAGGMRIDSASEQSMRDDTGMIPMRTSTAIRALRQALASGRAQVMVMEGDVARMRAYLSGREAGTGRPASADGARRQPANSPGLEDALRQRLVGLFAEATGMSEGQIDPDEPLESYGIDSYLIAKLNHMLSGPFSSLPKTVFFEHRTLASLSAYVAEEFPEESQRWVEPERPAVPETADDSPVAARGAPALTSLRRTIDRRSGDVARDRQVDEPIAIIGMSGRFPRARTVDEFWDNLRAGNDCVTEIPGDRWPLDDFYTEDVEEAIESRRSYSKWGGFLDDFADFDPFFFKMSPREALEMDPQERLFLEECWKTFEDAAYTRTRIARQHQGKVGVFAGITRTGFELYGPDLWRQGRASHLSTNFSSVANRLSYVFDLNGPSLPIDTMCSSSLSAVHEACEHLRRGDCEMALAGGVNIYTHPATYVDFCKMRMLSPDGECRSFGANANGIVPGEGVVGLLLKPLSRAVADGDHIYATIRGSSINHDGKTNGYTVPNPTAQRDVIRQALDRAGVEARTVSYIEAHGTGTELGDPIEIAGLTHAFRHDTTDRQFCAIGSAKSNIGHLEGAAGIAGVVKIILQLRHGQLAPSLHAKELNPNIDFDNSPFYVQRQLADWSRPVMRRHASVSTLPRIAGVSSFGAGGANAHVVIEEYDPA
ncbi:SDR family NAD(P)-dependent oxidoreductase [Phytoactinopolyspora halophila]|nr:SDR family NAD(P)-dependent oxidoreductase [Phytoactinopolyspora halophila]